MNSMTSIPSRIAAPGDGRTPRKPPRSLACCVLVILLLCCLRAPADTVPRQLPDEIVLNPEAGRKGFLFVTLRLDSGEALPFMVDTGSPITLLATKLEPKLVNRLMTPT